MSDPYNAYKNPYNTTGQTMWNPQVGSTGSAGTNFSFSPPGLLGNMNLNQIRTATSVGPYGTINVNPMAANSYNTAAGLGGGFQNTYTSSVTPSGVSGVNAAGANAVGAVGAVSGLGNTLGAGAVTGYTPGSFMHKVASSGFGKAMGNLSTIATKAMPIIALGAAIGGMIASRRAKKRERARKRKEKKFAQETQTRLVGAAGRIGEDVSRQAQFQRDAFALQGEGAVTQYEGAMDKAEAAIGATNLAGSGSGQQLAADVTQGYQLNARQRELAFAGDRYRLEREYESRIRDVESSLLGLQQQAGQRGYSLGSVSVLDRLNRGIG
tara:strand:+ start:6640 stop:7611 length:972 start_codon:yes stop_codon:yes gene_type:complete